jgi:hypothetical protein
MDIDHVYETLKVGMDILAGGTGTIQERLRETWIAIHTLKGDDFPLELRDDFHKFSDALTTGVRDDEAREIALLFVQLFAQVSADFWPTHKKAK